MSRWRLLKLEQCGLPPAKRFSFYDQVHTTGIDIPQPAAAVAALTLGKDMTFRDYAQAAYRMRGIGKGQTIVLFVIPEIGRLLAKEAALGRGATAASRSTELAAMAAGARARGELEDVSAWLLLNSMATEKVQFELWALQCARNVWRKAAHKLLVNGHARFGTFDDGAAPDPVHSHEQAALDVFREKVEQDVSSAVPSFPPSSERCTANSDAG